MTRLVGQVAIVTGAGRGIGRAHALLLAQQGASVVVNDLGTRPGSNAHEVAGEILAAGGTAIPDTTSATWEGADRIVARAIEAFGRVDILINNATAGGNDDLWRFTEEEWERTLGVNLTGYFAMTRAVVPDMARRGSGAIVNTSSQSGFGHPSHVAYASAKEGVIGLTRTTAMEMGRFGIRCNAIRPLALGRGVTEYHEATVRWRELMDLTMGTSTKAMDPDAFGADKVAPFAVWLCTDAASAVNGRTFLVSGGRVSLLAEPKPLSTIECDDAWTLDALDQIAPVQLTERLRNRFRLDDHPELQHFAE